MRRISTFAVLAVFFFHGAVAAADEGQEPTDVDSGTEVVEAAASEAPDSDAVEVRRDDDGVIVVSDIEVGGEVERPQVQYILPRTEIEFEGYIGFSPLDAVEAERDAESDADE